MYTDSGAESGLEMVWEMADNNPSPSGVDGSRPTNDENSPPKPHPSNSRRRTKTGCLTCRRRRIKCGEERPICQNCTKSKRNCEGYNQRVVFKAPMQGPMSSIPSHSGTLPKTNAPGPFNLQPSPRPAQTLPLPNILPKSEAVTFLEPTHFQGFVNNSQSTFGQQASTGVSMSVGQNSSHPFRSQNLFWQHYEYRNVEPSLPSSSNNYQQRSPGSTQHAHLSSANNGYGSQHGGCVSSGSKTTPQETPPSTGESESSCWAASRPQVSPQTSVDTTSPTYQAPSNTDDEMDEDDENDPYDVSSDDEMADANDRTVGRARDLQRRKAESNLQAVRTLRAHQDRQHTRVRTYHSVIESFGLNMLATYEPSFQDSPLNDPLACRIFTHFINVVAPGISMYERHPANASLFSQEQTPPKSQQHLWAYFLPKRALQNHALLHAMLAMSSLHIAKLQDKPTWISLKHYHYAIRKLAKNVSIPGKRKQLDTLATTLLLGFYEVMSADHSKWCDHLLGSHQLIKNINFSGMTKHLKQRKMQEARQKVTSLANASEDNFDLEEEDTDQDLADEVDDNIVSLLMGKKVNYGEMGEVIEDYEAFEHGRKAFTKTELEKYQVQRDLFWWFLKQDTIQSILSQNRLFLNYERWSHCPPRAPIGRRDAVHGTFDHLILLLGRLSDFASRDLKRKKRATGAPLPRPPKNSNAPQAESVCATSAETAASSASSASGGPPTDWRGGPPPGWQGPPSPGWTGRSPPDFNASHCQETKLRSSMQGGRPPGWKDPPPPGWTGGQPSRSAPPADSHSPWNALQGPAIQPSPTQTSPAYQGGPAPGYQGPPPPGWTGPPHPGFGPSTPMSLQGPAGGPQPASQRLPPPGWDGLPPRGSGPSPPMGPRAASTGISSGLQRPSPPRWIGGPRPTSGPPPQSESGGSSSMPQLPPFAGMLPTGKARLPRGFSPDASSPSSSEDSDGCPDGQRTAAEEEWTEIGEAFALFKEQLGPDFQELPAEYNAHIDTPFGPGIQYRGYNISVIWLMYYMGLIVWHRAHPSQLPSAMVAAAMTAHQTNKYANIIGRIAAGMAPDARTATTVAISTGSGLNDSVFSLFVAGVQYQDPAQRQWVIQRMLDTERLTGWETATQVAKGLETSWTTAAKMGRGPPYERYVEPAPVNMIWNRAAQRMDRMLESAGDKTHVKAHNEAISSRAAWATGILGIENKLSKINISSEEDETEQEE